MSRPLFVSCQWNWRLTFAVVLVVSLPRAVDAHLVTTGLGPVYDGIGHLLVTPHDLIAVVTLCLLAGLRGPTHARRVLFWLPLVWFLAGSIVGSWFDGFGTLPFAAISFIVLGLLVAADVRINPLGISVLAIVLGTFHGLDNGVAMRAGARLMGLGGITVALFVVVAISSAIVLSQQRPWNRIVVRVLGSWVVATGIMLLGWHYRPESPINKGAPSATTALVPGAPQIMLGSKPTFPSAARGVQQCVDSSGKSGTGWPLRMHADPASANAFTPTLSFLMRALRPAVSP